MGLGGWRAASEAADVSGFAVHANAAGEISCYSGLPFQIPGSMARFVTFAILALAAILSPVLANVGLIDGGKVCGEDRKNYATKEEAHANGVRAMHGGSCGHCSTHQDINMYNETRNYITEFTTKCSFVYLFFGEWAARKCMAPVNFTSRCLDCWVANISCDLNTKCLWICMRMKMRGTPRNLRDGRLNDCLQCDEDVCGKPFIDCAGANRRRSGILSDIDRPGDQVWEGDDWKPGVKL